MKSKTNLTAFPALGALALLAACGQDLPDTPRPSAATITAEIADPTPESRSCVDGATLSRDFLGIMWEPEDCIGVYGTADRNARFTNESTSNSKKTTFSGEASGTLQLAYYPYSEANDSREASALLGTLPAEQPINGRHINADYKVGRISDKVDHTVSFTHILSLARIELDASGTSLSDETLKSIGFSAKRGEESVAMSGDFTFSAVDGSADFNGASGSTTSAVWADGYALSARTTAFISLFPNLKAGDRLTITILTDKQEASFTVTLATDFAAGTSYVFPLQLNAYEGNPAYGWKSTPVGSTEEPDPQPETISGTFTCAAMNVDGLPSLINSDGPGSNGTKTISQAIAAAGWDFFGVSEDFEYNSELLTSLTDYNHGTFRGTVNVSNIFSTADTDGLNFFWKNGIKAENETMVAYNDKKGDLTHGADEKIKKGFRHYEVTVAEGVVIDVYITHMNTYSGSGNTESNAYVKAVLSQLRQVRDYIVAKVKENHRPAIFMGDTNMRYTRHDIKTNLIDAIAGENVTFNDPWVDFHRGGVFPAWNTKSLMIRSKFAGDKTNDIVCSDNQRGEVVDKIWYFNCPGAPLQLTATDLYNDDSANFVKSTETATYDGVTAEDDGGNITTGVSVTYDKKIGIADHFPVVAKFKWTLTK